MVKQNETENKNKFLLASTILKIKLLTFYNDEFSSSDFSKNTKQSLHRKLIQPIPWLTLQTITAVSQIAGGWLGQLVDIESSAVTYTNVTIPTTVAVGPIEANFA